MAHLEAPKAVQSTTGQGQRLLGHNNSLSTITTTTSSIQKEGRLEQGTGPPGGSGKWTHLDLLQDLGAGLRLRHLPGNAQDLAALIGRARAGAQAAGATARKTVFTHVLEESEVRVLQLPVHDPEEHSDMSEAAFSPPPPPLSPQSPPPSPSLPPPPLLRVGGLPDAPQLVCLHGPAAGELQQPLDVVEDGGLVVGERKLHLPGGAQTCHLKPPQGGAGERRRKPSTQTCGHVTYLQGERQVGGLLDVGSAWSRVEGWNQSRELSLEDEVVVPRPPAPAFGLTGYYQDLLVLLVLLVVVLVLVVVVVGLGEVLLIVQLGQ
ncbi:hypothetical protein EYF80_002594 [Liparis tanakae]|uniref:Uncharacterized protein n=1 Tax=Liparis tanakae TaxID=230148 RepID=A0A4Z2JC98_9TELE|nr:hypothetical protein EYF80_002594 [Liparis tanakae]